MPFNPNMQQQPYHLTIACSSSHAI